MKSFSATNQKVSWFEREVSAGSLVLTPKFQRKPVWSEEQASYLIDTILCGLPFPEVYLRSETSTKGETRYEVVDGQQRLTAILSFAHNDLVLKGEEVRADLVGKQFEDLSSEEKSQFWEYSVVVRELKGVTDVEIRELFRRLNINAVTLEDQEFRHAKYKGEFIVLMEELANDVWWVDHRIVSIAQARRMQDVEFVSELFVGLMAGPQDKKSTLDDYYDDFENSFPERAEWRTRFLETRALLERTLGGEGVRSWSGKSDFYSLFLAFGHFVVDGQLMTPPSRRQVREALEAFKKRVDVAKRLDSQGAESDVVWRYAQAVTRAASDIARRKARHEILVSLIDESRRKVRGRGRTARRSSPR